MAASSHHAAVDGVAERVAVAVTDSDGDGVGAALGCANGSSQHASAGSIQQGTSSISPPADTKPQPSPGSSDGSCAIQLARPGGEYRKSVDALLTQRQRGSAASPSSAAGGARCSPSHTPHSSADGGDGSPQLAPSTNAASPSERTAASDAPGASAAHCALACSNDAPALATPLKHVTDSGGANQPGGQCSLWPREALAVTDGVGVAEGELELDADAVRVAESGVGEPLRDASTPGVSELVSDALGEVVRDGEAVHAGVDRADGSGSGASDAGGGGGGGSQPRSARGTSQQIPYGAPP